MQLQGKGFFIWKIVDCEGGNPAAIADQAAQSKFTHVLIKIADGVNNANVDAGTSFDRVPGVVQALRQKGISPWGWHYVYGNNPQGEAAKAIQRLQATGLDGYVIDAEVEYTQSGKAAAARSFMAAMRSAYPNLPMALSSYRYPSYHPQLPWQDFLNECDYNMPQVYWEQAHNPAVQLNRTVQEFQALTPFRPVIPTGPTYKVSGWQPTNSDITEFLNLALSLNLSGVNFFSWDECRRDLPGLWTTIHDYGYAIASQPKDLPQQLIDALNTRNPGMVAGLYNSNAVHVTAARTIQGAEALKAWYASLFGQVLPNATFTLKGSSANGSIRTLVWEATSNAGRVLDGSDTLGVVENKISYHYSFFTITK
ncbi:MAG TPA: nuclear transport factor 2 family protein [Anaerolineaceae bacterium]|nr:nuclear transport factor 2 family protein [Anaerolineaceae bacterium]